MNSIRIDCPERWSDMQVEVLARRLAGEVPKMVGVTVTVMARTADGLEPETFTIQEAQDDD